VPHGLLKGGSGGAWEKKGGSVAKWGSFRNWGERRFPVKKAGGGGEARGKRKLRKMHPKREYTMKGPDGKKKGKTHRELHNTEGRRRRRGKQLGGGSKHQKNTRERFK